LGSWEYLETCRAPKIFIQSTHDEFGPRPALEAAFAKFAEPKQLLWIESRDHFFTGGVEELEEAVREAAAHVAG
jgi:alpha/beta superfamily hydrolase